MLRQATPVDVATLLANERAGKPQLIDVREP